MASPARLGLIGVGRWGKVYLKTLLALPDRCRLTHLATSDPRNAALLPHPVTVVSDWRALMTVPCDALIIATPPQTHAEILEACVEVGKACIVEKPLCLDVATAERLHHRVQASGVPVLVNHIHLFDPAYQALKQALAEEGEPIRVIFAEGMSLGPFRTDAAALWDWGPHDLSLCLDLLGQMPRGLDALAGSQAPDGVAETMSIRLDFPSGACAWIQIGRLAPHKRRVLSVITERRVYLLDGLAEDPLTAASIRWSERYRDGVPEALTYRPIASRSTRLPMVNMLHDFLDGLAGGPRERFGTALALQVVRLLAACEAAAQAREPAQRPHLAD